MPSILSILQTQPDFKTLEQALWEATAQAVREQLGYEAIQGAETEQCSPRFCGGGSSAPRRTNAARSSG